MMAKGRFCNTRRHHADSNFELGQYWNHSSPDKHPGDQSAKTSYFNSSDDTDYNEAIFALYKREKIKQLKRKIRSHECIERAKAKKSKAEPCEIGAFTHFSVKYFNGIVRSLSDHQKAIIERYGFGCLLKFNCSSVPTKLVKWIAKHVDTRTSEIILNDKIIPFNKHSFSIVFGLPVGGAELQPDSDLGRSLLFSKFGLTSIPDISFFGNMLKKHDGINDEMTFLCFMIVAISSFLCPSSNSSPRTEHLTFLLDADNIRNLDWPKFVYDGLLSSIRKFNDNRKLSSRKKLKRIGGCHYGLAVIYLDFLDYGLDQIDQTIPRTLVWKNMLLSKYAEIDMLNSSTFGKRPIKDLKSTCYSQIGSNISVKCCAGAKSSASAHCGDPNNAAIDLKDRLDARFGDSLSEMVKVSICSLVSTQQDHSSVDTIVLSVIELLHHVQPVGTPLNMQPAKDNSYCSPKISGSIPVIKKCERKISVLGISHSEIPAAPEFSPQILNEGDAPANHNILNNAVSSSTSPTLSYVERANAVELTPIRPLKAAACVDKPVVEMHTSPFTSVGHSNGFAAKANAICEPIVVAPPHQPPGPDALLPATPLAPVLGCIPITNAQQVSPDVVIVGERSFQDKLKQTLKRIDQIHNSMEKQPYGSRSNSSGPSCHTSSGKQHPNIIGVDNYPTSSIGKERPSGPKQPLFPTRPITDPFPGQTAKFPVSQSDMRYYQIICHLASVKAIHKTTAFKLTNTCCSYKSFGESLVPKGHVDNFFINAYCRHFFDKMHPGISGKHHFFSFIGESIFNYSGTHEHELISYAFNGANGAKRLASSKRLYFPICVNRHWFLFIVDIADRKFVLLDSLNDEGSTFQRTAKNILIDTFKELWIEIFPRDKTDFESFTTFYPTRPKQDNLDDCGIFVMKYMELYSPQGNLENEFSQDDIPNIRIQYANQLYFHRVNQVDKSVVLNFNNQG